MSIRYGQICPVSKAAELLGERWTLLIIRELVLGTTRFNDFQRALSQISPTLLTKRLNQLEEAGLLVRKTMPGQKRIEYYPTAASKELKPIILGLGEWGMRWARGQMNDDELDVEMLMYDLQRRIDASQLPGGRTVIKFLFRALPKFGHWWIVIEADGTRVLCVHNPRVPVDIELITDLRTMSHVWAGDMDIRMAKDMGRLQLKGDSNLMRTISSWLQPGTFAHIRPESGLISIKQSRIRKPGNQEKRKQWSPLGRGDANEKPEGQKRGKRLSQFLDKAAELYAKM
jgi:DNA-binding HxlR family transcriptional regulator